MILNIPKLSIRQLVDTRFLASLYLVIMCVQLVAIEGYEVSPVKAGLMALAPLVFLLKSPYLNKALIWGLLYWAVCFFCASFQGKLRFSSVGYLGMFVFTYILFYTLVHRGAYTLEAFTRLLRKLIFAFGIILVLQQLSLLIGIRSFGPINLNNQFYLSLTKLPSLTIEPSHSARILSVLMLGYLRCLELSYDGKKVKVGDLFTKEHRWIAILFLWSMLTMGSGTAFVGLALLCLYFIEWKNIIYIVPLITGLFFLGQALELEQMDRVVRVAKAAARADSKNVIEEDGSAAYRVIPIINTLNMDFTIKESWVGHGTTKKNESMSLTGGKKISIIEQFGLLGFFASLILIFGCAIRKKMCLESLLFLLLTGFSLGNIYYCWAVLMIFSGVRYFQEKLKKGVLMV